MHRYYIELNTMKDIEEFTNICSRVSSDVTIRGKDENNCGWSLSAKSLLCSVVMSARLQRQRKHTAHEVDWILFM